MNIQFDMAFEAIFNPSDSRESRPSYDLPDDDRKLWTDLSIQEKEEHAIYYILDLAKKNRPAAIALWKEAFKQEETGAGIIDHIGVAFCEDNADEYVFN